MPSWWVVYELVDKSLSVHLGKDAPLVVVAERPPHRLVVHVGLVLVKAPQPGDCLAVHNLEDTAIPVQPADVPRAGGGGLQQGEQELPQEGVVARLVPPLVVPGGRGRGGAGAGREDRAW